MSVDQVTRVMDAVEVSQSWRAQLSSKGCQFTGGWVEWVRGERDPFSTLIMPILVLFFRNVPQHIP
jgi:chemotaxis regulatin CheY-phosphate phosphatase CheZ